MTDRASEIEARARAEGVYSGYDALALEFRREMAQAFSNTGAKVDKLYAALDGVPEGDEQAWTLARAAALRARLDLIIHREAIGLRRHDIVYEVYPTPPAHRAPALDLAG